MVCFSTRTVLRLAHSNLPRQRAFATDLSLFPPHFPPQEPSMGTAMPWMLNTVSGPETEKSIKKLNTAVLPLAFRPPSPARIYPCFSEPLNALSFHGSRPSTRCSAIDSCFTAREEVLCSFCSSCELLSLYVVAVFYRIGPNLTVMCLLADRSTPKVHEASSLLY